MALPDVKITKKEGLGRRAPSDDGICGLVCGGVPIPPAINNVELALLTPVKLKGVSDAEFYGINAMYDTNSNMLVYHHIKRFFKRNPSGTLWLMLVDSTPPTTLTTMVDKDLPIIQKFIQGTNGEVKVIGFVLNPRTSYVAVTTNGIDANVETAVPKAQALANAEFLNNRPINILLEGRSFTGTAAAVKDMRTLASPAVSVVIAQDLDVANTGNAIHKKMAAVGDVLGCISAAKVNECIGWVDKFPLQDLADNTFVNVGLSSNLNINNYTLTDLDTLHDKGYIFARPLTGLPGFYWSSDPSCAAITVDEAYLSNGRTLNKAARLLRTALIGKLNSPIELTSEGKIKPAVIGSFESAAEAVLRNMQGDGEISAYEVYIDPDVLFMQTGETVTINFKIVPVGVARQISGVLKLTANL